MAKVADEFPSANTHASPPSTSLSQLHCLPQSAVWSIIILISFNCISNGWGKRKAFFLRGSRDYVQSASQHLREQVQGEATWPRLNPPSSSFASTPLSSFIPNSSYPSFLSPCFPPTPIPSSWSELKQGSVSGFLLESEEIPKFDLAFSLTTCSSFEDMRDHSCQCVPFHILWIGSNIFISPWYLNQNPNWHLCELFFFSFIILFF